jgi:hypothetical protein
MSATKGLFGKYLNRVFVETGCNFGDGIQQALDEGFKEVYSCDIDSDRYHHCIKRFHSSPVHIKLTDTSDFLRELMPLIHEPVTFWLDAHKGNGKSPLLQELDIIWRYPIKTNTILIDDLRDWKREKCGFDTEILKRFCLKINSKYNFVFEDGFVPNDILVAKI